jgi:MerR family mercuric resistance operon transcriptional regulator
MKEPAAERITIGRLARHADVGVETVRYYQRRGLLPTPGRVAGGYRTYGAAELARLRFIRRAQELGFALDEIGGLLRLSDGADRRLTGESARRIAAARLAQVRARRDDLDRMARVLAHLIHECERSAGRPACPIIEAIVAPDRPSSSPEPRRRAMPA